MTLSVSQRQGSWHLAVHYAKSVFAGSCCHEGAPAAAARLQRPGTAAVPGTAGRLGPLRPLLVALRRARRVLPLRRWLLPQRREMLLLLLLTLLRHRLLLRLQVAQCLLPPLLSSCCCPLYLRQRLRLLAVLSRPWLAPPHEAPARCRRQQRVLRPASLLPQLRTLLCQASPPLYRRLAPAQLRQVLHLAQGCLAPVPAAQPLLGQLLCWSAAVTPAQRRTGWLQCWQLARHRSSRLWDGQ